MDHTNRFPDRPDPTMFVRWNQLPPQTNVSELIDRELMKARDAKEEYIRSFMLAHGLSIEDLVYNYEFEEQTELPDFDINKDVNEYVIITRYRLKLKEKTDD